jgi:DNA end-binding protein Ku
VALGLLHLVAMARALWNGALSFGLVTVPVRLFSAVESREALAFHLLHKKDGSRIVQKRFCKAEDVEVPWSDVVKGYQHARDEYVVVTEEDFERARVPATQAFEIRKVVPAADIEDLYFDHPYYVAPRDRSAAKPYALLRDALAESGRVAVGTIVLREREHLAALQPVTETLVLTTMRFAHEIRAPKELDLPPVNRGWTDKEMKLARQLLDTLGGAWDPAEYRDTYSDALREVIEARAEGKAIVTPETPRRPRVASLMQALQRSLEEPRRPLAKSAGERRATRRPARGGRRRAA